MIYLKNSGSVLQKSVENKTSTDDVHSCPDSSQFSYQSYMDEFKVCMLVNRMHVLENYTLMLYDLYVQNRPQMSRVMRKPTFWFPTWSDTNQAVQLQKMARGLKFRI